MIDASNLIFHRIKKIRCILQTESAECGLACLAMIACHHGFQADLSSLRNRFGSSLRGATLEHLIEIADQLRLVSRPVKVELEEMHQLGTPSILHWQMNHFVVLTGVTPKGIYICDPAVGTRHLPWSEVDRNFTGIALELSRRLDFQESDVRRKISYFSIFGQIAGLRRSLGWIFLMALCLQALSLLLPLFNQWVMDEALVTHDKEMLDVLIFASLLVIATQTGISYARGWSMMYLSTQLGAQWFANIFAHLLSLPISWFEKRQLGDIASRFDAAGAIQQKLTTGFISTVLDGLIGVASLVMMFYYSPSLAMIAVASVSTYGILRLSAFRLLKNISAEGLVCGAREQTCFLETFRAIRSIKLSGSEHERRSRWISLNADSINCALNKQKIELIFENLNTAISGVVGLVTFRLGAMFVMDGIMTIGMLVAFGSFSTQFASRMSALIDSALGFRMLTVHAERLADIVLEPPELQTEAAISTDRLDPRIELIDVGYRYSQSDPWVIKNFNLTIEPGESIVFTGPSGCGKTTLIKLVIGAIQPTEGEIRYGGIPIHNLGTKQYRKLLAAVMQDDQLLAGSIRENISSFDQNADQNHIKSCAKAAALDNELCDMPMGYETLVGELGTTLSGGQKQRIFLARALYRNPKVLLLDEATSNLDVASEQKINSAMSMLNITRIIVAHRRETIESAERVIYLNKGMIEFDAINSKPRNNSAA